MWAWSVSLNFDKWPAFRARFNSERTKVISGSNDGFKARNIVQQPNRPNSTGVQRRKSMFYDFVLLKVFFFLFVLLDFFFELAFHLSRHSPEGLKRVASRRRSNHRKKGTNVHVPRRSMSANVLRAVVSILPPRFSWLLRRSRRTAGVGRVITRRDRSGGLVKHKEGN